MLDISTHTLIYDVKFSYRKFKQHILLEQLKKLNLFLIFCTHMHILH